MAACAETRLRAKRQRGEHHAWKGDLAFGRLGSRGRVRIDGDGPPDAPRFRDGDRGRSAHRRWRRAVGWHGRWDDARHAGVEVDDVGEPEQGRQAARDRGDRADDGQPGGEQAAEDEHHDEQAQRQCDRLAAALAKGPSDKLTLDGVSGKIELGPQHSFVRTALPSVIGSGEGPESNEPDEQ